MVITPDDRFVKLTVSGAPPAIGLELKPASGGGTTVAVAGGPCVTFGVALGGSGVAVGPAVADGAGVFVGGAAVWVTVGSTYVNVTVGGALVGGGTAVTVGGSGDGGGSGGANVADGSTATTAAVLLGVTGCSSATCVPSSGFTWLKRSRSQGP